MITMKLEGLWIPVNSHIVSMDITIDTDDLRVAKLELYKLLKSFGWELKEGPAPEKSREN